MNAVIKLAVAIKCLSHVSCAEKKTSHKCSIHTKKVYLSNFEHKFVYIPVSEMFSKLIHLPDKCGKWRILLNSMIIIQVSLVLGTIKDHTKISSSVTQYNAKYVSWFEGVSNWHADCRNVHMSCWKIIESQFLYHQPPPTFENLAIRPTGLINTDHMYGIVWVSGFRMSTLWTKCPMVGL